METLVKWVHEVSKLALKKLTKSPLKHPNVYTFSKIPSYIGETEMLRHARHGKTALSWRKIARDSKRDSLQDSSAETAVLGISDGSESKNFNTQKKTKNNVLQILKPPQ